MVLRFLVRHVARVLLIVLAAGFLGASLVRFAPAFGICETELDPRLHGGGCPQMHDNTLVFYIQYLKGAVAGDFGLSPSLGRPIAELLRERLPVSLRSLAAGAGTGLAAGLAIAILVITLRTPAIKAVPVTASTILLSVPSAALALLFLVAGWPPSLSLAAVIFPRVYRHSAAVLGRYSEAPHVLAARARGVPPRRILLVHIIRLAGPQLLAIAGMAVTIGFPALVPIEAVCDSPGVLQLAWKAALARDLPLLVTLTMIASAIALLGNAAADFSSEALRRQT